MPTHHRPSFCAAATPASNSTALAPPSSIFDPPVLDPTAFPAVADHRFGDASALIETDDEERANGAHYLLGFVVKILLNARLIRDPAFADRRDALHGEVFRAVRVHHDLGKMCALLDDWQALYDALRERGRRDGVDYERMLKKLAGEWTVFARYATVRSDLTSARAVRDDVERLKEILK